ncbi:MAG: hypothetical protein U0936_10970 [Planctomycetaceae bacterium]
MATVAWDEFHASRFLRRRTEEGETKARDSEEDSEEKANNSPESRR